MDKREKSQVSETESFSIKIGNVTYIINQKPAENAKTDCENLVKRLIKGESVRLEADAIPA